MNSRRIHTNVPILRFFFCIYEAWHWNIECPEADFCDKGDGRSDTRKSNFLSSWKHIGLWSLFLSDMEGGTFFLEFGNVCSSPTYSRPCVRVLVKVIRILRYKWQKFEELDSLLYSNIVELCHSRCVI